MPIRLRSLRRPVALALTLALCTVPALAAAGEPPVLPARTATPIADSAARAAADQGYHGGHDDNAALKWTGFGLLAGGGSLIAIGAVIDDQDCFANDVGPVDCNNARKAAYLAGGIMAGVGVGLLIMASHSDHGGHHHHDHYPDIAVQRGRMIVQQRVQF